MKYSTINRRVLREKNSIETLYKILDFCTYTNLIENVQISTSDTYVSFPADKLKLYDRGRNKYQLVGISKIDFSFDVQPSNIDDIFSKDRSNFEVSLKDGTDIHFRFNKDIDMYIED